MKRSALIIATLCAMLLLAAVLPAAASSRHPFRGNWRGIDVDGSTISLWIVEESRSGGKVFEIRAHDDRTGEWCGGPANMRAIGVLETDTTIATSLVWWCLPSADSWFYFLPDVLTYDAATDTIFDTFGVTYTRSR